MKRIIFVILAFVIGLLFACEDTKIATENGFSYNSNNYEIDQGIYVLGDYDENMDEFVIIFKSPGLTLGQTFLWEGKGHFVALEIILDANTTLTDLPEGEFSISDNSFENRIFINLDVLNESSTYFENITSGTLSINSHNDSYEVSFNCITESEKAIEGYYEGEMTEYLRGH